ncbi:MAG: hypothetical protein JWQ04_3555 [Pedosphaera sp.]|nr:hypothetical protein [Pedosphaera sp.]
MNEKRFWLMIEQAWEVAGDMIAERKQLASGDLSEEAAEELCGSIDDMLAALSEALAMLDQNELLEFDRILERKLYEIDRAEIQAHTDGSDDGFLYARGFIVAAGKAYYEAVNAEPQMAMMNLECEEMCYLSYHMYIERFGKMAKSEISRESGSNAAGWPDR